MRASLSSRILIVAGAAAVAAGIAIMAVGLLSYLGQDSAQNPTLILRTFTPSPEVTPKPALTPSSTPPLGGKLYRLTIDSIGVDGLVQTLGLDENAIPEVPTDYNSDNPGGVIAWYDFSAEPGTGSNAVFAGHNTWYGNAIFGKLGGVQAGDMIKLRAEDGTELVYAVSDIFMVDPEDPGSLQVMRATPTDTITLITCGGTFIDTNDPVFGGEYTDRVVVRADLMNVTTVGAPPAAASGG